MNSQLCSTLFFVFLLPVFQVLGEEVKENPLCSKGKNCCWNSSKEYWCPENSSCCDNQDGCCGRETQTLGETHELKALPLPDQASKYDSRLKGNSNYMGDTKHVKKTKSLKKSWNSIYKSQFCYGRKQKCPNSFTCCLFKNGQYGCCPYPSAICCNDMMHCCPKGSICSVETKACVPIYE